MRRVVSPFPSPSPCSHRSELVAWKPTAGLLVDVFSQSDSTWYVSRVLQVGANSLRVHFEGWHAKHDFDIQISKWPQELALLHTHTAPLVPEEGCEFISEFSCSVCGEGGDVLCCDSCCRVFHLECIGRKEAPEKFACAYCVARAKQARLAGVPLPAAAASALYSAAAISLVVPAVAASAAAAASSSSTAPTSPGSSFQEHKSERRPPTAGDTAATATAASPSTASADGVGADSDSDDSAVSHDSDEPIILDGPPAHSKKQPTNNTEVKAERPSVKPAIVAAAASPPFTSPPHHRLQARSSSRSFSRPMSFLSSLRCPPEPMSPVLLLLPFPV